jgi:hypothetical protein
MMADWGHMAAQAPQLMQLTLMVYRELMVFALRSYPTMIAEDQTISKG